MFRFKGIQGAINCVYNVLERLSMIIQIKLQQETYQRIWLMTIRHNGYDILLKYISLSVSLEGFTVIE